MSVLAELADLIHERNRNEEAISAITGRPASLGHLGEFIASRVFDIRLSAAANTKGIDGHFDAGPLKGRSVNIKWYAKFESLLDVCLAEPPDFYLVLTGPPAIVGASGPRPWLIHRVFLFEASVLDGLITAKARGIATSVRKSVWDSHELYPRTASDLVVLSEEQRAALALFGRLGS